MNRIKDATENPTTTGGSSTETWKQTFTYDRYGNRRFDEANTTMPSSFSNPALTNPTFDASNNRMASGQNWTYDSAGNVTGDPEGRTFIYDAENKQVNVATIDENGNPIATVGEYAYDGDGKRVKKIVPGTGETTISVYDASNKLVAEYSTIVEPVATAKTSYLTTDHLGSPRVLTDQLGHVISRHDFHPFGEEIATP